MTRVFLILSVIGVTALSACGTGAVSRDATFNQSHHWSTGQYR